MPLLRRARRFGGRPTYVVLRTTAKPLFAASLTICLGRGIITTTIEEDSTTLQEQSRVSCVLSRNRAILTHSPVTAPSFVLLQNAYMRRIRVDPCAFQQAVIRQDS